MAKYLVETYYTCTFKVNHYLDDINETELKNLEKRDDGKFEVLDVKLDNRKTKSLDPNNKKIVENKKIDVAVKILSFPWTLPEGSNFVPTKALINSSSGTPYCRPKDTAIAKLFIRALTNSPSLLVSIKISPIFPSSYSPVCKYTLWSPIVAFWM